MSRIKIFVILIVIGEGGSGGVFVLVVVDRVFMLEYLIYLVFLLEGFVLILWKDVIRVKEVVEVMKIIVKNLKDFNIIDDIIKEFRGGVYKNLFKIVEFMKKCLIDFLGELRKMDLDFLVNERYNKFRKMGNFY